LAKAHEPDRLLSRRRGPRRDTDPFIGSLFSFQRSTGTFRPTRMCILLRPRLLSTKKSDEVAFPRVRPASPSLPLSSVELERRRLAPAGLGHFHPGESGVFTLAPLW
jgi:hypothetical protein